MIKLWLEKNKAIAMALSALAMVALLAVASWQLVKLISDGGRAQGREQAKQEIVEDGNAENAARRRVRDCRAAGRLPDARTGECPVPAAGR